MPLNVYIFSSESAESKNVRVDDYQLVDVLGKKEEALAVRIDELFDSVVAKIGASLSQEAELDIEVSGSIELKAEGGVKWLFFNLGGSATKNDAMKVTLKTKVKPNIAQR